MNKPKSRICSRNWRESLRQIILKAMKLKIFKAKFKERDIELRRCKTRVSNLFGAKMAAISQQKSIKKKILEAPMPEIHNSKTLKLDLINTDIRMTNFKVSDITFKLSF